MEQHWDLLVAADFFTIEAWTQRGLQRFIVLFFIELSTREVEVAGIASVANGLWMNQIGRNLTDTVDGMLGDKRYLIHDRDPLFPAEFLKDAQGGRPELGETVPAQTQADLQTIMPSATPFRTVLQLPILASIFLSRIAGRKARNRGCVAQLGRESGFGSKIVVQVHADPLRTSAPGPPNLPRGSAR